MADSLNFEAFSLLPFNFNGTNGDPVAINEGSAKYGLTGEAYHYVEVSHPAKLLSGLNEQRKTGQFCDIVLSVNGKEFPCHRPILCTLSRYFTAMFSSQMVETNQKVIPLSLDAEMIEILLDFAYTSEVKITKTNAQALLAAADQMEVLPVKEACGKFIEKNIDEVNCFGVLCFAEMHACYELQERATEYAVFKFDCACQQDEFLQISQSKLIDIISRDQLRCESEEMVFESVIRWLNYDYDTRSEDFFTVLEHVRLALLNPYYLCNVVEKEEVVLRCQRCKSIIDEAKSYQLLKDKQSQIHSCRTKFRMSYTFKKVIVAVGGENRGRIFQSTEAFDPYQTPCDWKHLEMFPVDVSKHGLVSDGDNLYLAGGEFVCGTPSMKVFCYSACLDTWDPLASMFERRSELGLALLNGYMYAVGGWCGEKHLDSVEQYNFACNTWSFVAPLKMALASPAVVQLDGCLYVTGGSTSEALDSVDLVQCYNPRTDQWTEKAPLLKPISGSGAAALNGKLYIIGGGNPSSENTNKVYMYDPHTDQWSTVASLLQGRYSPGVAVVSGKIYVCGGEAKFNRLATSVYGLPKYLSTVECYDPETDTWETIGEMKSSKSWLGCASLVIHKDVLNKERDDEDFVTMDEY